MKPIFQKEIQIKSLFTYQHFLKKGYRLIPKLTVKLFEKSRCSREAKAATKKKILRIFKNTKGIKRIDLATLLVHNLEFWSSTLIKIAKKLSSTASCLRVHDTRKQKENYEGLATSWPKYMKHLRSLYFEVFVEKGEALKEQKNMKLVSDYLRYLPNLSTIEIKFRYNSPSSDLNGIWKFEKYPKSIKKLHFHESRYGEEPMNTSMAHLKNLKDLKFGFRERYQNTPETVKSALNLIPQVSQIEALEIDFVKLFKVDESVCAALKSLTKLKKIKLSVGFVDQDINLLPTLKSLEDCPLEYVDLRAEVYSEKSVLFIKDFIEKKKGLKILSIQIMRCLIFESFKEIKDLLEVIDDLPQLTSLCFSAKTTLQCDIVQENILPEINFPFENLFGATRLVPLKKFNISINQHSFSSNGFMKLLNFANGIAVNLEELQIDVGEYKPKIDNEMETVIEFIKSLKNIQCLKLGSLNVPKEQFFFDLIEAIESLKFLRDFSLGEVSGDVTKLSYIDGVKRILSKNGLEKFNCEISKELKQELLETTQDCLLIDREEIRKKNLYHENGPFHRIYLRRPEENYW